MEVSLKVLVMVPHKSESYSSRDYDEEIFEATIKGSSTGEVEGKVGKLQEAITHMGWKLK